QNAEGLPEGKGAYKLCFVAAHILVKWYFYHLSASNLVYVFPAPHHSWDRPRRRIGRSWGGISGRIFWQRTGPDPGESKCSACCPWCEAHPGSSAPGLFCCS